MTTADHLNPATTTTTPGDTMSNEFTQTQLLDRVTGSRVADGDPRVRQIAARIIGDLFRAIDDLDVQPDEFWAGVDWLARLGASGQSGLITAGLGFDRLLDIRLDEADLRAGRAGGTPRAIEGPLYVAGAPLSRHEARLDVQGVNRGELFVMEGRVLDTDGRPVAGAIVDVWHANEHGRYSHFDPEQAEYALRRRIETDAQGRYRFRSVLPPGYAIPPDSPTSELFAALGRHGNRPAHIHFLVVAAGRRTLTTQVNIPGDTFIDDDFAFATRDGLILQLEKQVAPTGYESLGVQVPFTRSRFDFVLQQAASDEEASPQARLARALA
jgi:catechol 1,2-dioxygenase